ncbi:hypothetical protein [Brachybacterium huguangmaarense]
MSWYADGPRRIRQIAADAGVAAWALMWILVGIAVHRRVDALAAPVRDASATMGDLRDQLLGSSDDLGRVPAVGETLGTPFRAAADRLGEMIAQADAQAEAIARTADWAGVLTALVPVAILVALWLPRRVRFARRSASARRVLAADGDLDLFALRALATAPMEQLARISADPAADWRRRDPEVVRALATLELRRLGVRAPRSASGPASAPASARPPR